MAEAAKTKKGVESLSELFFNYLEASRDAHLAAQKQYSAAWRKYLESVRDSLKEKPVQDAAQAFAQTLHPGLSTADAPQVMQAAREYADAAKEAELALSKSFQDSFNALNDDIHQSIVSGAEAQKAEVEKFLKSFQDAFCATDIKNLDAAALAKIGHTMLAASWFRAHFG